MVSNLQWIQFQLTNKKIEEGFPSFFKLCYLCYIAYKVFILLFVQIDHTNFKETMQTFEWT